MGPVGAQAAATDSDRVVAGTRARLLSVPAVAGAVATAAGVSGKPAKSGGAEAAEEGLARAPVEVAVAQAALEGGLARAPVEVVVAQAALEEGLARAPVEVAVAQAALEEVAPAGPAPAAGSERVAAVQATVDQTPVGRAAAEDRVQAAEALPVAAVSGAREGNPVNGWRLRPCCAAPRWAGWAEQEASALA